MSDEKKIPLVEKKSDGSAGGEVGEAFADLVSHMQELLAGAKINIDTVAFASLLWSYISGLGYKIVQGEDPKSLENEVQLFVSILKNYLEGKTKA